MKPFVDDPDFVLWQGEALETLRELPDESVDCCVTSPPYYALRDYGTGEWAGGDPDCDHARRADPKVGTSTLSGGKASTGHQHEGYKDLCGRCGATRTDKQVGLEATPEEFIAKLVAIFSEVRRTLRPHGTLWVNIGDSYAQSGGIGEQGRTSQRGGRSNVKAQEKMAPMRPPAGIKAKDMIGIPWLLAFALRADGWYLRMDVIWSKPNPMPESVTDRPTKAHEYVFLLSKSPRYFYDREASLEPYGDKASGNLERKYGDDVGSPGMHRGRAGRGVPWSPAQPESDPDVLTLGDMAPEAPRGPDGRRLTTRPTGPGSHENHRTDPDVRKERWPAAGRNMRSVWEIPTHSFPEAHFATFPEELARKCIVAGCPELVCNTCGKPRERIVESSGGTIGEGWHDHSEELERGHRAGAKVREGQSTYSRQVVGFTDCGHDDWIPGVVLDPFMGSGTTALVARSQGRAAVGIELNVEYAEMIARRLQQLSLLV